MPKPTIIFYAEHAYYLPQFMPVVNALQQRGAAVEVVLDAEKNADEPAATQRLTVAKLLQRVREGADWLVFGNEVSWLKQLPASVKTALLYHGVGVKACYYDEALSHFDVRFTEGAFRHQQLQQRYPKSHFQQVGFAKLDPIALADGRQQQALSLTELGLDPNKQTVLYAPTFYPSSIERMPLDWPQQFSDYNIIIKPHAFSMSHSKYDKQRQRFAHWQQSPNVHFAKQASLLPYMATADILLSEASSALFEFAALNKPVIWIDFLQLRWSYRGPLRFRFDKRMDQSITEYASVARHVSRPSKLFDAVQEELQHPQQLAAERQRVTAELIGEVDGKVSARVADYLLDNIGR